MIDAGTPLFTVAVFQDAAWAQKGLDALKQAGFPADSISIVTKESADAGSFIDRNLGAAGDRIELPTVGAVLARGPLMAVLNGPSRDLATLGLSGTLRRVGFQPHDGQIFETLTGRGGVLVAIRGEPRAADALAILHSYGGGNAAIGAWAGRL